MLFGQIGQRKASEEDAFLIPIDLDCVSVPRPKHWEISAKRDGYMEFSDLLAWAAPMSKMAGTLI